MFSVILWISVCKFQLNICARQLLYSWLNFQLNASMLKKLNKEGRIFNRTMERERDLVFRASNRSKSGERMNSRAVQPCFNKMLVCLLYVFIQLNRVISISRNQWSQGIFHIYTIVHFPPDPDWFESWWCLKVFSVKDSHRAWSTVFVL